MSNVTPSEPTVHTVTTARRSPAQDRAMRTRRYLISMSIRTLCFVLLVVIDHPIRWVFLVGAAVLPYLAVVLANAVDHRAPDGEMQPVDHQRALRPSSSTASGTPLEGRVVEHGATRADHEPV